MDFCVAVLNLEKKPHSNYLNWNWDVARFATKILHKIKISVILGITSASVWQQTLHLQCQRIWSSHGMAMCNVLKKSWSGNSEWIEKVVKFKLDKWQGFAFVF